MLGVRAAGASRARRGGDAVRGLTRKERTILAQAASPLTWFPPASALDVEAANALERRGLVRFERVPGGRMIFATDDGRLALRVCTVTP